MKTIFFILFSLSLLTISQATNGQDISQYIEKNYSLKIGGSLEVAKNRCLLKSISLDSTIFYNKEWDCNFVKNSQFKGWNIKNVIAFTNSENQINGIDIYIPFDSALVIFLDKFYGKSLGTWSISKRIGAPDFFRTRKWKSEEKFIYYNISTNFEIFPTGSSYSIISIREF